VVGRAIMDVGANFGWFLLQTPRLAGLRDSVIRTRKARPVRAFSFQGPCNPKPRRCNSPFMIQ